MSNRYQITIVTVREFKNRYTVTAGTMSEAVTSIDRLVENPLSSKDAISRNLTLDVNIELMNKGEN